MWCLFVCFEHKAQYFLKETLQTSDLDELKKHKCRNVDLYNVDLCRNIDVSETYLTVTPCLSFNQVVPSNFQVGYQKMVRKTVISS